MRTHTNDFKTNIKNLGRQFNVRVVYGGTTLQNEEINNATLNYNGDILKSVMKMLKLDSNVDIPLNTQITFEFGLLVGNLYEYIKYGTFIVEKSEKQENTNSYLLTCYDKMLYSMKPYEDLGITYPITIRNYINALCTKLGLQFQNASDTFVNYNKQIPNELYLDEQGNSLDYNYRDVLDELAQVTASTICINDSGKLEIRYITNTNDTIDEEFLKNVNVNFGEQYGAINTITFSRSADSDSISKSIPENLPDADKIEIKISDNQILNGNNRDEFIDGILNQLYGLSYYVNDFSSTGITYYDLCDRYNITVGENTYSCVMLNDEININNGLVENIFTNMPETSKTDYSKVDKTDRKANQTYIIVNKQQGQIDAVVSQVDEIEQDLSNPTNTLTGQYFDLEDALDEPLIDFKMYGDTQQDSTPTPSSPQDIHNVSGDNTIEICGKNLLVPFEFSRTNNGITFSYNADGSISLNGTSTGTAYAISTSSVPLFTKIKAGTYTLSTTGGIAIRLDDSDGTNIVNTITSTTFTLNEDKKVFIQIRISSGTTITNQTIYPMLEKSSTATEYEAYIGNSQLISLGVKNLLTLTDGTFTDDNNLTVTIANGKVTLNGSTNANYLWLNLTNKDYRYGTPNASNKPLWFSSTLIEKGQYSISSSNSNITSLIRVMFTDASAVSSTNLPNTTTKDIANVCIYIASSGTTFDNETFDLQITKGSTPQYVSASPIELCKIGTYQDYIYKDNDRWYLHKEIGKWQGIIDNIAIIDGSSGSATTSPTGTIALFLNDLNTNISNNNMLSNMFTYHYDTRIISNVNATRYLSNNTFCIRQGTNDRIYFLSSDLINKTKIELQSILTGLSLYYVLANSTDTEITIDNYPVLYEQLNTLMTLPLYKNLTHITLTPNDLQPMLEIEYYRDTAINTNFLPKDEITKYYTKVETNAQIKISSDTISSEVARVETKTDDNNGLISGLDEKITTNQSSNVLEINALKKTVYEDGVEILENALVKIDTNGLNVSKGESFNTQMTDRAFEVNDNTKELIYIGYDNNKKTTVARMDWLESEHATIGVHRTEIITRNNQKRTAGFYVGGGN